MTEKKTDKILRYSSIYRFFCILLFCIFYFLCSSAYLYLGAWNPINHIFTCPFLVHKVHIIIGVTSCRPIISQLHYYVMMFKKNQSPVIQEIIKQ